MKRWFLSTLVALWACAAQAQNVTVIGPVASGNIPQFNSTTVIKDSGFAVSNFLTCCPVFINPTPLSTTQGIVITQTTPSSNIATASPSLNYGNVTISGTGTNAGYTNAFPNNIVSALRFDVLTGGAGMSPGNNVSGLFTISDMTSGGALSGNRGIIGYSVGSINRAGVGALHGGDGVALVDVGGSYDQVTGFEASAGICDGSGASGTCRNTGAAGAANKRIGLFLPAVGQKAAITLDAAIVPTNNGASAAAAWGNFISFSNFGGFFPVASTGDFFNSDSSGTLNNIFNASNITVTNSILSFPNLNIGGNGGATFGAATAPTAGQVIVTQTSGGQASIVTGANTTSGVDSVQVQTSLGTNFATLRVFEPANTQTGWGFTLGNYAALFANLAANNGLIVGTITAKPIIFGVNNVQVGQWSGGTPGLFVAGLSGSLTGQISMAGATSGGVTQTVPAASGIATTVTWGSNNGTPAVTSSAPLTITTATGNITCATCATTTNGGALSGTSPIAVSAAGAVSIGAPYGATTYTANGVLYGNSTSNIQVTAQGGANSVLTANAGAPAFSASPTIGTSVTTPLVIGGTAAGSSSEIRSTSGTGSGDKVVITGGTNGGTTLVAFLGSAAQTIFGASTTNQTTPVVIHSGTDRNTGIGNALSLGTGNVIFSINDANTTFQGLEFRASQFMFNDISGTGVSIGSTTAPGANGLFINGQLFVPNITQTSVAQTGTVCWTSGGSPAGKFTVDTTVGCLTSLEEAKNILSYLRPSDALRLIDAMQPFTFRYRDGWGDNGRYEQYGLGAHQVASVDERLVGRDLEGTLHGVRYQELVAVLVGAIQELKADNDTLRGELKTLAAKIK